VATAQRHAVTITAPAAKCFLRRVAAANPGDELAARVCSCRNCSLEAFSAAPAGACAMTRARSVGAVRTAGGAYGPGYPLTWPPARSPSACLAATTARMRRLAASLVAKQGGHYAMSVAEAFTPFSLVARLPSSQTPAPIPPPRYRAHCPARIYATSTCRGQILTAGIDYHSPMKGSRHDSSHRKALRLVAIYRLLLAGPATRAQIVDTPGDLS